MSIQTLKVIGQAFMFPLFRQQYTTNQNKFYTRRKLTIRIFISRSSQSSLITTMERVRACEDRRRAVETRYFALLRCKRRQHSRRSESSLHCFKGLVCGFSGLVATQEYRTPEQVYKENKRVS